MNIKDAIKSLNVEDLRPRDRRSHRLDRQTVNSFDKDNRLDRVFEAEDGSDEEFDREVDGQIEDGQMMQEDNIQDVYQLMQGEQMPLQPKRKEFANGKMMSADPYAGFADGKGPAGEFDEGLMSQIFDIMSAGGDEFDDGGLMTDGGLNYADQIMAAMKGRDIGLEDILTTLQNGGAGGRGNRGGVNMDPQALIEMVMADKVTGRMAGDGFFGKNQSRIGGADEPRKKIGKGEQRVNRKDAKYNQDGSEATPAEKKDRNASSKYKKKNKKDDD